MGGLRAVGRKYKSRGAVIQMKIVIINGPNLNMLGIREPALYGRQDYELLEEYCRNVCRELSEQTARKIECKICQSNHEGEIVTWIQQAFFDHVDGIIINPAAYTHSSIAILDALKAAAIPAVEVHLTNIQERETFRHTSYAGMACEAHYIGHGFKGYRLAVEYLMLNYGERGLENGS